MFFVVTQTAGRMDLLVDEIIRCSYNYNLKNETSTCPLLKLLINPKYLNKDKNTIKNNKVCCENYKFTDFIESTKSLPSLTTSSSLFSTAAITPIMYPESNTSVNSNTFYLDQYY